MKLETAAARVRHLLELEVDGQPARRMTLQSDASIEALRVLLAHAEATAPSAGPLTIPDAWPQDPLILGTIPSPWSHDMAGFAALVQRHPSLWLCDSQLKYMNVRIDTRDGGFVITDRADNLVPPDRVLTAMRKSVEQFGEAAYGR